MVVAQQLRSQAAQQQRRRAAEVPQRQGREAEAQRKRRREVAAHQVAVAAQRLGSGLDWAPVRGVAEAYCRRGWPTGRQAMARVVARP